MQLLSSSSKSLRAEMQAVRALEEQAMASRDASLLQIGNLVHDDVPIGKDEVSIAVRILGYFGLINPDHST